MKCAIISALTLLSFQLCAQTPSGKAGSVDGTVTNSATGEPVKKAAVTLQATSGGPKTSQNSTLGATTDASGHFHFDHVDPGTYRIAADRDGFIAPAVKRHGGPLTPFDGPFARVNVGEEQHVQDIAIKLIPMGVASGHVLDEDGDPIVRARVTVLRYYYNQGRRNLSQAAFATTNDLGEFEALNLAPGRYYFQATAPSPRNIPLHTRWAHGEEAYPITFYPNARDMSQASGTDIAAGAHVNSINFGLRKMPSYHIRGTVVGETGGEAGVRGQVGVTPESLGTSDAASSPVRPDGSFDVAGLVSGSYEVTYQRFSPDRLSTPYASQAIRISDSDVNAVVLAPKPPLNVAGAVTVEGAQSELAGLTVLLEARTPPMRMGQMMVNSPVGADGTFTIIAAVPEASQVQLLGLPQGKYIKSIRFGDREIKNGEMDLSSGVSAPLRIVLGEDGGEVEGNVQKSGAQAAETEVTLVPGDEYEGRTDLFKRTFTDASGNFQIKDVAPGQYKVFAWEDDPGGSVQSAEFRKAFESRAVSVTVGPSGKASVQLELISSDDIEKELSKLP
jgi:protocatechuate 3,4-dioxygenase beta subunit